MTRFLLLFCLLLTSVQTHAQLQGQQLVDSLEAELENNHSELTKATLYNQLALKYARIKPEKGIEYAELALSLSKKVESKGQIASAYEALGMNNAMIGKISEAKDYFEKSLNTYKEINDREGEAKILNGLANVYYYEGNYKESLLWHQKSLKIKEEIGDKEGIARSYGNIGFINKVLGNKKKALENFFKVLEIFKEIDSKENIAKTLNNIGIVYQSQSDYSVALDYFFKSLSLFDELGDKKGIAQAYKTIGANYKFLEDYQRALEYFRKSAEASKEINDIRGLSDSHMNIGSLHNIENNHEKALESFKKAMEYSKKMGDKSSIAAVIGSIADTYNSKKEYNKALKYINESLEILKEIGEQEGIARAVGSIGITYYHLATDSLHNSYSEKNDRFDFNKEIFLNRAIENLNKSIQMNKKLGRLRENVFYTEVLASVYKEKNEDKKRAETLEDHIKYRDSLYNIDKEKEIANLTAVREKEVAEKELKIQQLENVRKRNESYLLYGGITLLVLVLFVLYRQGKRSDKLLLNILPAKIAKRLKKRKGDIADDIENASTVFIDLVGFTEYSKDKKASDVLKMLNQVFSRIDKLVLKHGLEKIKTIGDGYMAAAGVPEYQEDHSKRAADFALDVHKELEKFNKENGTNIKARIGIESGPMVAGVVGDMKFIYDLWGDSVNTASRMESTGIPNKVHITENFKLELEKHKNGFAFSEPIELDIKGKGMMKTYYLKD